MLYPKSAEKKLTAGTVPPSGQRISRRALLGMELPIGEGRAAPAYWKY